MALPVFLRSGFRAAAATARCQPSCLLSLQRRGLASLAGSDGQLQMLSAKLQKADPAVFDIIEQEKQRQKQSINLIPSENFTSQSVLEALGSVMQSELSRLVELVRER